jgi:hypothetical protein
MYEFHVLVLVKPVLKALMSGDIRNVERDIAAWLQESAYSDTKPLLSVYLELYRDIIQPIDWKDWGKPRQSSVHPL